METGIEANTFKITQIVKYYRFLILTIAFLSLKL